MCVCVCVFRTPVAVLSGPAAVADAQSIVVASVVAELVVARQARRRAAGSVVARIADDTVPVGQRHRVSRRLHVTQRQYRANSRNAAMDGGECINTRSRRSSIAAVHRRRPCVSRDRGSSVEQSARFRHGVNVAAHVQATPEDCILFAKSY